MSNAQKKSPAATQPQSQPQPQPTSPQSLGSQFSTLRINTGRQVNQDGAFLQDKVIKSGWLFKRTRKTRTWKLRWFVLLANRLLCYKDQKEYKIHRQIYFTEITAVTAMKDPKKKLPPYIFGVFTSSKNYQLRSETQEDTQDWIEKIWTAVAAEVPEAMMLSSPIVREAISKNVASGASASSHAPIFRVGVRHGRQASAQTLEYSGPDVGSVSSLSDAARVSQQSLSQRQDVDPLSGGETIEGKTTGVEQPRVTRSGTGYSLPKDIWHGYLYCLKSTGGVKQWKRYWIVVRNANIGFYKDDQEYRAIKILPLDTVVDAVEIDPLSKSRRHCLQIISETKAYRFSAPDEEVLVTVLGALKSTLSKSIAALPATPPSQA